MSKALTLSGSPEVTETARLADMMDKLFDCLNVSSFTAGKHARKPFQDPWRTNDFRLKVSSYCHTHLLLTTPTSHTHRFHPLSKIVIHTSVQYGCAEVWMTILESGWNLWVWLVGVVSRRWVWLVGGIYGYGYNV